MQVKLRRWLKSVPGAVSTVTLARAVADLWRWRDPATVADWCSGQFARCGDPFGYGEELEQRRFASAAGLLARAGKQFDTALEIGCAEGHFTLRLAPCCRALTAIDLCETALDRARQRCTGLPITFRRLDFCHDALPGSFGLVVVMDILEMVYDPRILRSLRDKIVDSVEPGGYVLLGNSRQNPLFERVWWTQWLLRGGKRISQFFAAEARLAHVADDTTDLAINSLFRRTM